LNNKKLRDRKLKIFYNKVKNDGKFLYCNKCKKYPDEIIEKYLEPILETRIWDRKRECYELTYSNLADTEFEELCGICKTKLEHKE
jgi:hypothetical protein